MRDTFDARIAAILPVERELESAARAHLDKLTKPKGSLGKLEDLATQIYCIQHGNAPCVDPARIYTIAGDHGVITEGVSASPQEVTRQMVMNFMDGGGGINVLTDTYNVDLVLVDAGSAGPPYPEHPKILQHRIASGTANMSKGPAMKEEECLRALLLGMTLADEAHAEGFRTIGTGEMGVGNTTPSTALYCAFFGLDPMELTGPGTGLDEAAVRRKAEVIRTALRVNGDAVQSGDPVRILTALGGLEIAALTGLILGAAERGMIIVVDGFISSAAYAAAWKICPHVEGYTVFSHASAEPGHQKAMEAMKASPLLHLGLYLGEGTGAAIAMSLLRGAVNTFNQMANFDDAGVTEV